MNNKLLTALLSALLATLAVAAPGLADVARKRPGAPVDERAHKTATSPGPPSRPQGTVSYGGTIAGGPEWDRPFIDCTGLSALGPVRYQVEPFYVGTSGSYTITSIQDGWDGVIFVYQGFFNPAFPNANCLDGNDDGPSGVFGTSELIVGLTASVQYLLVTTAFEEGQEGSFTNSFDGPGAIILAALGGEADISLEKSGDVSDFGAFDYLLTLRNGGPDEADGVTVVDQLPGNVAYVSDDCAGFLTGPSQWTWQVGTLPAGGSANCRITVRLLEPGCQPVFNLATASATPQFDPDPSDNVAIAANFSEQVADGGFEGGSPNADWIEQSANFGTPLCTAAGCGTGGGTGPHGGDWWTWFGGIGTLETASMTQAVTIPPDSILSFFFEAPACGNSADFLRVQIDGATVWEATGAHPQCNTIGYQQHTVELFGFDDGGVHDLVFSSTTAGSPGLTNFFIDDISIRDTDCVIFAPGGVPFETTFDVAIPALSRNGILAMAALIAAGALLMVKRR